jgi:hypothetical protein
LAMLLEESICTSPEVESLFEPSNLLCLLKAG